MHDAITCTINGTKTEVKKGTLISTALQSGHAVSMPCGGRGICRKCRVYAFGELSAPSQSELACFSEAELKSGLRLACCTRMEGACSIQTRAGGAERICADGVMPDFVWSPTFAHYGAAIDIGTTTLALHIYDRQQLLAEVTAPNPQSRFGGDVISRITKALEGEASALALSIQTALAALLEQGAQKAGIAAAAIDRVAIAGNTAMLYLLTGRDAACLARAPFAADHLFGETVAAKTLGLPCPEAEVYLAACMSAYVGGDITMALLSSELCNAEQTAMLADIGTNGEIALFHNGELYCCSTAAGPAFEGAGLSMGMTGQSGAIDHVSVENGRLCCHVIDEAEPIGICGSGIVDAVACLLELGQLNETCCLAEDPVALAGKVTLTGQDIRMIQLAKGAVRAGMETLLQHVGIAADDLQELAVAGGFGSYINKKNAMDMGLLVSLPPARVRVLGNAALLGAAMVLLDKNAADRAAKIASRAKTVELAGSPVFQEQYMEAMLF